MIRKPCLKFGLILSETWLSFEEPGPQHLIWISKMMTWLIWCLHVSSSSIFSFIDFFTIDYYWHFIQKRLFFFVLKSVKWILFIFKGSLFLESHICNNIQFLIHGITVNPLLSLASQMRPFPLLMNPRFQRKKVSKPSLPFKPAFSSPLLFFTNKW